MYRKKALLFGVLLLPILIFTMIKSTEAKDILTDTMWSLDHISTVDGSILTIGKDSDFVDADINRKEINLIFNQNGTLEIYDVTDDVKYQGTYVATNLADSLQLELSFEDLSEPLIGVCGTVYYQGGSRGDSITIGTEDKVLSFLS